MSHRDLKDPLYAEFARVGHAIASPKRIEFLDLLGQGPKTVEDLAAQSATPVKSTSAHLAVLRGARLVEVEREGTYMRYRLGDPAVATLIRSLQNVARVRLAEVERVASEFLSKRDGMRPVSVDELRRLLREGDVTLVDVRPRDEFEAGHIAGARSIPVAELRRRLKEIPKRKEVVAYCRGPYCVYAVEAVAILRKHGFRARRSDAGISEWRAKGFALDHAEAGAPA